MRGSIAPQPRLLAENRSVGTLGIAQGTPMPIWSGTGEAAGPFCQKPKMVSPPRTRTALRHVVKVLILPVFKFKFRPGDPEFSIAPVTAKPFECVILNSAPPNIPQRDGYLVPTAVKI